MMSRVKHILEATEVLLSDLHETEGTDPALAEYVGRTLAELEDYELVPRREAAWRG
jgi:hypothetical protein